MKKTKLIFTLCFTIILLSGFISNVSYSRIINVNVSNFSFTPASITNAVVGDTIQWTRTGGSHTTTCNGTNGTTRPAGAAPWDAPMTSGSPTFKYVIQVAGMYNYVCTPHEPEMAGTINATTSSISQINEIVTGFKISQNYPNPFNPETMIKFSVPNSSQVTLKIFNNVGQEIATLVNENLSAASYEVNWNAADYTSGVYFYRINAGNFSETRKM
ncbi:MAG: T9SS type A sorting domain-containing protein, partial [Ignavibacteria bacterium]|nr:T9SS type A sorting domain-containing protein [Ignavibacteria bacterium]